MPKDNTFVYTGAFFIWKTLSSCNRFSVSYTQNGGYPLWITAISLWLRIENNKSKSEPVTCYDKVLRIIRLWWAEMDSKQSGFLQPFILKGFRGTLHKHSKAIFIHLIIINHYFMERNLIIPSNFLIKLRLFYRRRFREDLRFYICTRR